MSALMLYQARGMSASLRRNRVMAMCTSLGCPSILALPGTWSKIRIQGSVGRRVVLSVQPNNSLVPAPPLQDGRGAGITTRPSRIGDERVTARGATPVRLAKEQD